MKPILSALKRTVLTAPYWTNPVRTFKFFLETRKNRLSREPLTWFQHRGLTFGVRPIDWYAMETVILEEEYILVKHLFQNTTPKIIIDAGANIGLFSIYALSQWPKTEIFAIEASLETYTTLKKNWEKNPGYAWHIFQYALWNQDGQVFFNDEDLSLGWHVTAKATTTSVPAICLDSFIDRHIPEGRISLLKIDIEGAEQAVLEACPEILERVDSVLIEIHPNQCDENAVISVLREKFSHLYCLPTPDNHFPLILANRHPLSTDKLQALG